MEQKVRSAMDVGRMIAARRRAHGLTQLDLAGVAGTGNRFVCELERGKGSVQFDRVMDVLDQLGLDVVIVERP